MRENSGRGKAQNSLKDPTLKEHEAEGGHRPPRPVPGGEAKLGTGPVSGERHSPSGRIRGEISSDDEAPAIDEDTGR